jgi:hypothetical protein
VIKEKTGNISGNAMVEETGLPIGKIEIKHEKKCRNDFRHF